MKKCTWVLNDNVKNKKELHRFNIDIVNIVMDNDYEKVVQILANQYAKRITDNLVFSEDTKQNIIDITTEFVSKNDVFQEWEFSADEFKTNLTAALNDISKAEPADPATMEGSSNIETMSSVYEKPQNREQNLLFLDYAFRGMNLPRQKFEKKFRALIWESCFIGRGSLGKFYPGTNSYIGQVETKTQLNDNLKDLQESLYGALVDHYNSMCPEQKIDKKQLYETQQINWKNVRVPTYEFLKNFKKFKNYFNSFSTEYILSQNTATDVENEGTVKYNSAKSFMNAYEAYVLLNNFDSYMTVLFGDDMEILPQNVYMYNGGIKYQLADKSKSNKTTHAEIEEVKVDKLINYIVKGGIESTQEYEFLSDGTGKKKDNHYLNYADFATIMSNIKSLALHDNAYLDITKINGALNDLSSDAKAYVRRYKTLRGCLAAMKLDPLHNISYVMELLNSKSFYEQDKFYNMMKERFPKIKRDKLYSIYRGIFGNFDESLRKLDVSGKFFGNFTQNAISVYDNNIIQYYIDKNGVTKVRSLTDSDKGNIKFRMESAINNFHSLQDTETSLNVVDYKKKIKSLSEIAPKFFIPISNNIRLLITCDPVKNGTHKYSIQKLDNGVFKDTGYSGSTKYLIRDIFQLKSDNELGKTIYESLFPFISHELCIQITPDNLNLVNVFREVKGYDKGDQGLIYGLQDLLKLSLDIHRNAIIKLQAFSSSNTTYQEQLNRLKEIYGENTPEIISKNQISLLDKNDFPIFDSLVDAVSRMREVNLTSTLKSGEGNTQFPYSLSRLFGGFNEQVELQCNTENSVTKDSAIIKQPGFFKGTVKSLELYRQFQTGLKSTDFNSVDFHYGNFVYQYIAGMIPKNASKDLFKNGTIGVITSVNSDKGEISIGAFNLNKYKIKTGIYAGKTLYSILTNNKLKTKEKKQALNDVLKEEIGPQYLKLSENIEDALNNNNNGLVHILNRYVHEVLNDNTDYFTIPSHAQHLTNFDTINSEFSNFNSQHQNIKTLKDLIFEATRWFNTVTVEGLREPIALPENVIINYDKQGFLKTNPSMVSLLYRYNPEYITEKSAGKIDFNNYLNFDSFFNYKAGVVAYDLINSRLQLDLSEIMTQIAIPNAAIKRQNSQNQEQIYIKEQLQNIEVQGGGKWIGDNGMVIIGKYTAEDGTIYNLTSKTDLYLLSEKLHQTIDERFFLNEAIEGRLKLNPLIEQYNLVDYLCSTSYIHCSVGTILAHPAKNKPNSKDTLREQILADESFRYSTQTKRNVSLTATVESYQLAQRDGIPTRLKVAPLGNIYAKCYNSIGDIATVKIFDGCTHSAAFMAYWENNSLQSARAGLVKKPYGHFYNERYMTASNLKTAEFPITNENMRKSSLFRQLMKNSSDLLWRNADGSIFTGDITKTVTEKKYTDIVGNLYEQIGNKYYKIEIIKDIEGTQQYQINKYLCDQYGNQMSDQPSVSEVMIIDSDYKLWQAFGGYNSCSLNSEGKFVKSEASIKAVADLANEIGTMQDTVNENENELDFIKVDGKYFYQPLKHAVIHLLPNEEAIKMGMCNKNPNTAYYKDYALNWSYVHATQFGIQLDKEHHADQSEISMMTQVINACAFRGYTFELARDLYKSLYILNQNGCKDFLEPFEQILSDNPQEREKGKKDFLTAINKHLIKTLANRSGSADMSKLWAQRILDVEHTGEEIDYSQLKIPYSDQSIYKQVRSSISNILTKLGIKHKLDGNLAVLNPAYDVIKIYGNKLQSDFGNFDEEITAFQQMIKPAFTLSDTNANISRISVAVKNSSGAIVNYDTGIQCYVDNIPGNIQIVYNSNDKLYDVIFNIKYSDIENADLTDVNALMSAVSNAIPTDGVIRFGYNNKVTKDNLKTYELFRQYGFNDDESIEYDISKVQDIDEYLSQDKKKAIIPTFSKVTSADRSVEQKSDESQEFNSHFKNIDATSDDGVIKANQKFVADNKGITIVLTKDRNTRLLRLLSLAAKGRNKYVLNNINYTDGDIQNANSSQLIESISKEINDYFKAKKFKKGDQKYVYICGDSINVIRNAGITQAHFNTIMDQVMKQLDDKENTFIIANGQSGFSIASTLAAKANGVNWEVRNGREWVYSERNFEMDNRDVKDRWTNEKLTKNNVLSLETDLSSMLPDNLYFFAGSFIPNDVYLKALPYLQKKHLENKERAKQRSKDYLEKVKEYKKYQQEYTLYKQELEKYNENKEGKRPKAPKKVEEPKEPNIYKYLEVSQDISGRSIASVFEQLDGLVDENGNRIFSQDELYNKILLPLYKQWAYSHPRKVLQTKKKLLNNILYTKDIIPGVNIAHAIAEIMDDVSFAYNHDTTGLEPYIKIDKNASEAKKTIIQQETQLCALANKYIGYLPTEEGAKSKYASELSAQVAMLQDKDVINCPVYQKGDIVYAEPIFAYSSDGEQKHEVAQNIINEISYALNDNAIVALRFDEDIDQQFNAPVKVYANIGGQKIILLAKSQDLIDTQFIKKQSETINGNTIEYYIPSQLFYNLRSVNNRIKQSEGNDQNIYRIFDIMSVVRDVNKFKTQRALWEMSPNGVDPILHTIYINDNDQIQCFGSNTDVLRIQQLYTTLDNVNKILQGYRYFDIQEDIISKVAEIDQVTAQKIQDEFEKLKTQTNDSGIRKGFNNIKNIIYQLILDQSKFPSITYLSGNNDSVEKIANSETSSTRIKGYKINQNISFMYNTVKTGDLTMKDIMQSQMELIHKDELEQKSMNEQFTFNQEQMLAIVGSIGVINRTVGNIDSPVQTIVIDGKAGTGKTTAVDTILRHVDKHIAKNSHVAVCALSNKAKSVIDGHISKSIKYGGKIYKSYNAFTIAQLCGFRPDQNGNFNDQPIAKNAPIRYEDIVVIDEASMITTKLYYDIKNAMKPGSVLIFLGDKGQLSAINENKTEFDPTDRLKTNQEGYLFKDPNNKVIHLIDRIRQGENNPILKFADDYYNTSKLNILDKDSKSKFEKVTDNGAIIFKKLSEKDILLFQDAVLNQDLNRVRIIGYKNSYIDNANRLIHNGLCSENPTMYNPGEFIIIRKNYDNLFNGTECIIKTAYIAVKDEKTGVTTQELEIKLPDGSLQNIKVIPEMYLNPNYDSKTPQEKAKYDEFIRKNNIIDIGLAYAITVHKAQGSTYDVVYINPGDFVIPKTKNNPLSFRQIIREQNRMMYTALTRARNAAVLIDDKKYPETDLDLNDINTRINSKRVTVLNTQEYKNIKDLTIFDQNPTDHTMPVVFDGYDGPYIYDYKKGDILTDINNIKYEIVDDPFVYSRDNIDKVNQLFGVNNDFVFGSIIAVVKPIDCTDLKSVISLNENENQHKLRNLDLTKIETGKTYFVQPNPIWLYKFGEKQNYGKYTISAKNRLSDIVQIVGKNIYVNEELAQSQEMSEKDVQGLIYREIFKDMVPDASEDAIKNYVQKQINENYQHSEFIETPIEYYDLKDRINSGKVLSIIENVREARNLATINYTFKDVDGNAYQLNDIDSVKYLFKLRDIIQTFEKGSESSKTEACRELNKLAEVALGIKYEQITSESFNEKRNIIEQKLRIKQQRDMTNLSMNSKNILNEFDQMVAEFDGTTTYCQRAINWVNYVEGNIGRLTIEGFNNITPDSFKRDMAKVRRRISQLTKIQIDGVFKQIDKSTIECKPYEVVMPKTMAKQFGLQVGDSIANIISSYESQEYLTATKPSDDISYLGFFGKRQYDNWTNRVPINLVDIVLKKTNRKHVYLSSDSKIQDIIKSGFHAEEGRTQIDLYGRLILLNPDGTSRFEINKNDTIYVDNYGNEIIVTDNPQLYINKMHYTDIELNKDLLQDSKSTEFQKILDIISDEQNSNFIKRQIQKQIQDKDGNIDIEKAKQYFKDANDKNKLLKKFRRIGQFKFNSFKLMLNILATRIPAQCQHSFMAMQVVGFVDGNINNAFVSADQIWLQGSDFDIDTVSLATYSADDNGYIHLWSPYVNYSSYKKLSDSLRLPFPNGLKCVSEQTFKKNEIFIEPSTQSDAVEWLNKYIAKGVIKANLKRNKSNQDLFIVDKNAKIEDIINLLNDVPKIFTNTNESKKAIQSILNNLGINYYSNNIIQQVNDAILNLYNKHNLYLRNKDQDSIRLIANNKVISAMIEVSSDPMNMYESRTPIDSCKDPFIEEADKTPKDDSEFRQPGSFTTKANGITENQVGKKCISICAVGLKAQSAIQYYYQKVLNDGNHKDKQDSILFEIKITGKSYTHAADVRSKSPNTLSNKFLALLAQAEQTNDPQLASSALLSLSVDNAKDLRLAKLNALPQTIGMYIYGITLGVPLNVLTKIIMGPVGDMCIELLQGNHFVSVNKSFESLYDVLSYLSKSPFNKLRQKYNWTYYNGTNTKTTVYDACMQNIATVLLKEGVSTEDYAKESLASSGENIVKNWIHEASEEDVFDKINEVYNKIKDKYKYQSGDYPMKILQMLDDIKDYIRYKRIMEAHEQEFEDFKKLFAGANEMKKLGEILSLNQGLKSQERQSDAIITKIENIINDKGKPKVDIIQFVTDEVYRQKMIDEYSKNKICTFNILDIIATKEDVFGFLKDLAIEVMSSNNSGKFKFAMDNYSKVKQELELSASDADIMIGLRKFYDDKILDDFVAWLNMDITVPAGTTVFDKTKKTTALNNIKVRLGLPWTNATFKSWMETVVIPELKAKYAGNIFLRDLSPVESNKTISKNSTYYYAIPTVNLSPREDYEQYIFDKYVNEFQRLSQYTYDGYPVMDLFALYNIIAQRRAIGETTFTKLINSCNMKITNDLLNFIADKDSTQDYVIDGINITNSDILPYVVPMFSQKTTRSKYVRRRNPFTGEYQILKKNDTKRSIATSFEEEENSEYQDMVSDILGEEEFSSTRENWYGKDYSLVEKGIDYSYFQSGKISNSEFVKYTDNDGREYTIEYDTDTDEYGNHRLYKVLDYNKHDVKNKFFPFAFVHIIKEDLQTKVDFVGKYIMANDIDKSEMQFDFTEEEATQPMLVNLGKDSKGNKLPKLRLRFTENGKLNDMTILSENHIIIPPSELEGNAPVWMENGKLNINIEVLRKIYDQKINGCE